MVKILLAGDEFVLPEVLQAAVDKHLPGAETVVWQSNWPTQPTLDFGGIKEAVGDEDELIEALRGCDAIFTHTAPVTEKMLAASPDLKIITVCRGGPVNADKDAATEHGVLLTYCPGRNATATYEHTIGMILAAVRQIPQRHVELANGVWRGDYYRYDKVGPEVKGSTVGLVGFGAVGSRVAATMKAMGARVLVFDPYVKPEQLEGYERVEQLDDLMRQSNIVTIHARLTADNEKMIGAHEIGLMPKDSVLVNCARGGLLDYDAMCDALDSGHLYAAACDVLPFEPLPDGHRMFTTPNLTITPHLAGASRPSAELAAEIGATDIAAFFAGERPLHMANPEVLDKPAG